MAHRTIADHDGIGALFGGGGLQGPRAGDRRGEDRGTGGGVLAGAAAIVRDPYLAAIAAQTLLFTFASTFLWMQQQTIVSAALHTYAQLGPQFTLIAAPVLEAVLARGGRIAAGWLRSAMVRLPLKDRKAFERLWAKVMLEGEAALTTAERDTLRGLMQRLDRLVRNPLSEGQKDNLRDAARQVYKQNHPHLKALLEAQPRAYHVHHRRPLEYAHLFADDDINAPQNLALVSEVVHQRIGALWTKIRVARPGATAEEIAEAARRIDDQFLPWYHQASAPPGLSLAQAEEAALQSLKQLFPGLS